MRIFRLVIILLLAALPVGAQRPSAKGYTTFEGYPFVLCYTGENDEDLRLSDSLFNSIATGVQFKVNRTNIDTETDFYRMYSKELIPLLRREGLILKKIYIRGAASPEGPYENNRRLGQGRMRNLIKLIDSDLQNISAKKNKNAMVKLDSTSITEDYRYLVELMEAAHDADAAEVRKAFEQCQWDEPCCKLQLQKMQGGKLWQRLLKEYFPQLRTARIVILLQYIEPKKPRFTLPQTPVAPLLPAETAVLPTVPTFKAETPVPTYTQRHLIALRTNLLRDFFYMPQFGFAPGIDAQLEYYPEHGHLTYNIGFTWSQHRHWDDHKFFQVRDLQLSVRRYFRGDGSFVGPYIGAYAHGGCYGIGLSESKGWQGEHYGGGLDFGWVMPLNRKGNFRLELNVSAGYISSKYDPYVWGNPVSNEDDGKYYYDYLGSASSFTKRNHLFSWLGPTNAGVSLTYDIIYRKKKLTMKGGTR